MLLRQVEDGPAGKDAASALARRVVEALSLPFFVSQEPARMYS
jgi:diguanylate cyclase